VPAESLAPAAIAAAVIAAPVAPPVPVSSVPSTRPARVFLTGLPGTGLAQILREAKDSLTFNLNVFAANTLKATCTLAGEPPLEVINEFRMFGDGQYKATLENVLFLGLLRHSFETFGTPAFWVHQLIGALPKNDQQVIVVGVRTSAEFAALKENGFTHYHAMCTPQAAAQRTQPGETASPLAAALNSDVMKKISAQRNGPRLNVVWTDSAPPPSSRFVLEKDFKEVVVGVTPSVVESDSISQIL
jgi:hypothetical protein